MLRPFDLIQWVRLLPRQIHEHPLVRLVINITIIGYVHEISNLSLYLSILFKQIVGQGPFYKQIRKKRKKSFGFKTVGTGVISHFHAPGIANIDNAGLVGAYDFNGNTLEIF